MPYTNTALPSGKNVMERCRPSRPSLHFLPIL